MPTPLRQTRSYLMQLFATEQLHPRGDLGQNFLIDVNLIDYIVDQAQLSPADLALEVGTGTGGMTTFLAARSGHVISVDVDPQMSRLAAAATAEYPNVTLLRVDALKSKHRFAPELLSAIETQLAQPGISSLKLVANLPYSIATPVMSNLIASPLPWSRMVVTIQYELAARMQAGPGTGTYGALSAWLQSQSDVSILKTVSPQMFWPRPQVNSAIVQILPAPERAALITDRSFFQLFLRQVFQQRRKVLRSVLAHAFEPHVSREAAESLLTNLGLNVSARAEELPPAVLVCLANAIRSMVPETIEQADEPPARDFLS